MSDATVFWSYVHEDDKGVDGRIVELRKELIKEYRNITGKTVAIFLDIEDIKWGDPWRPAIDGALESIDFFIPVLTPSYFRSKECRRELEKFAGRADDELWFTGLIMPIIYIKLPTTMGDPELDDLVKRAKSFQAEDCTDLRWEPRNSLDYQRAVYRMAERLSEVSDVRAAKLAERKAATAATESSSVLDAAVPADDSGVADSVDQAAASLDKWEPILEALRDSVDSIAALSEQADEPATGSDARVEGPVVPYAVLSDLGRKLDTPIGGLEDLSKKFVAATTTLEPAVTAALAAVAAAIRGPVAADSATRFRAFFGRLDRGAETTDACLDSLRTVVRRTADREKHLSALTPRLRRLGRSLREFEDAGAEIGKWNRSAIRIERFLKS